jgi:predicted DNA-binding transcriptional regulator AlpA
MTHEEIFRLYWEMMQSVEVSNASSETLLDSAQMRQFLRCSESTLYRLRRSGKIPYRKLGGTYYFPKNFFTTEFVSSIMKKEDVSKRFDD